MGKIARLKLFCDVKGGAIMIDIKRHILSLKSNWIRKLFNDNYISTRKRIDLYLEENLYFYILRSNLKMTNILIVKLVFLKNSKILLLTIKTMLKIINHPFKIMHLWQNKLVKYCCNHHIWLY